MWSEHCPVCNGYGERFSLMRGDFIRCNACKGEGRLMQPAPEGAA